MRVNSFSKGSFDTKEVWGGAGEVELRDVFGSADFDTPFDFIKSGRLQPGDSVGLRRHPDADEVLVVFDEPLTISHEDDVSIAEPTSVVLFPAGSAHGFYNHGTTPADFFVMGIAPEGGRFETEDLGEDLTKREPTTAKLPSAEVLDRSLLATGHRAHLGAGHVDFRRLFGVLRDTKKNPDLVNEKVQYWTDLPFSSHLAFVDHAVLAPGCSVGYHHHDTIEECQIFISGSALMKVDGEVAEVTAGDCVPNRLDGTHGLINHTDEPVEFIAIAVSSEKGVIDFTNQDDDLRGIL